MLGAQRKWILGWTDKVIYRVAVNLKKKTLWCCMEYKMRKVGSNTQINLLGA